MQASKISEKILKMTPESIDVEVYGSFDAVAFMQNEWDDFIEAINGEIYLTFDWCRIWWKYYGAGRDLRIIVMRYDGSIIAILPMFQERLGFAPISLRVVKFVGTDHMPVTIMLPIDQKYLEQVVFQFIEELNRQYQWEFLYIGALCGRFAAMDEFVTAFNSRLANDYCLDVKTAEVQTYFQIADTWEKQLAGLKKNQRKNIKRAYEKLYLNNHKIESSFADEKNFRVFFEKFVHMHQQQWQEGGSAGHFMDWPHSSNFHREVALSQIKRGRLRLLKIGDDSACLGFKYGYRFGKTYYAYLSARNMSGDSMEGGFSQVSFAEQVKKAIEEKVTCIDSMRGFYPHKVHLGGTLLPIKYIFIHRKNTLIHARITLFRKVVQLIDICYYKIWRRRLLNLLKIQPSPLTNFWIKTHMLSK